MNYLRILFKNKKHKQNIVMPILMAVVLGLNQFPILPFTLPVAHACQGDCELTLTKTDFDVTTAPDTDLAYQLTLKNTGTANCTGGGVRLRDYYDSRTTYISSDVTLSDQGTGYVEWNFATVEPQEEHVVNIVVHVKSDVACDATLENKINAWSNETSWTSYVSEYTPVACQGDCELTLTKNDFGVTVKPGDELLYEIQLTNTGDAVCTGGGVRIRDYFDSETIFKSSDITPSATSTDYMEWNFGEMNPGVQKTVQVTMQVKNETACDSTLLNKVKYWSNETSWGPDVEETTPVECEVVTPYCGDGNLDQGEQCDDNNTVNNDGCNSTCQIEYGTISGCKYKDLNNNGVIDSGEPTISQWPITLTNNIIGAPQAVATTTTDINGCFEFTNLTFNSQYTVDEDQLPGWVQTYPNPTSTYSVLIASTNPYTNKHFANYQTTTAYCGDGVVNQSSEQCDGTAGVPTNYTCNVQCQLVCVTNCGGGGGGPTNPILTIDKSANVVFTNPGGIVDYTIAVKNIGNSTGFNLKITDLLPTGLEYYGTTTNGIWLLGNIAVNETKTVTYQVLFSDSLATGNYTNTAKAEITNGSSVQDTAVVEVRNTTVYSKEYKPILTIDKKVNMTFTNPGGEVTYTVTITNSNTGNLMAENVILVDRLPKEFYFNENKIAVNSWALGNFAPGESKTVSYNVTVKTNTKNGTYENIAVASADNAPEVYDKASLEIRDVKALGFKLPDTDGSLNYILSIILGMLILGAGFIGFQIKKEYQLV